MRVMITGGGTGGHIYPALAIARGVMERWPGSEVLYVGTDQGLEADIVPRAGFPFKTIPAQGLKRALSPQNVVAVWSAARGYFIASRLIHEWRPTVVIGTGGYVCGPVILAASRQGVPTMIHEQNAFPGVTNRLLSRFTDRTAITFLDAVKFFPKKARIVLTGLPIRSEILSVRRGQARKTLNLSSGDFMVLSFGGSRGAYSINQAMIRVIQSLHQYPGLRLYHATGNRDYKKFMAELAKGGLKVNGPGDKVKVEPYFYEIANLLAAADLVICRAGASTIAELTVLGLPSILVPFPYATGNHQEHNARALASQGAAILVHDRDLSGEVLVGYIKGLMKDRSRLAQIAKASAAFGKPNALEHILDVVSNVIVERNNR
ncbi:MAG: undecaprenyldiphospho-muramoylpentapeptide beta-N-acetylglucosaminyltransferase [Peptococcaceae bacterium]|nr:undecaprenyldiphospho-muramoylpentapeptide beta-N-acetylglucosaminyltransferase [Peptococcaceae bacterium]